MFIAFVADFIINIGFKLNHNPGCSGKGSLTCQTFYERARLGGVPIWRVQCTVCKAVFTVLPHFVLWFWKGMCIFSKGVYEFGKSKMGLAVAKDVLISVHGGLSQENAAVRFNISVMSVYRFVCSIGSVSMIML